MRLSDTALIGLLATTLAACGGSSGTSGSGGSGTGGSGGSSGGTTAPDVSSFEVLREFTDGSGIARIVFEESGQIYTATIRAPDIRSYGSPSASVSVDVTQLTPQGSDAFGDFFSGEVTVDGETVEGVYYLDFTQSVALLIGDTADGLTAVAVGAEATDLPTGSATYEGTNIFGDGNIFETGTFAMSVEFGSGTASIDGSTADSSFKSTDISIDTGEASFTGPLDLTIGTGAGNATSGTIYGNFHGDSAGGVSGIYHNEDGVPEFTGAIAGTKQ